MINNRAKENDMEKIIGTPNLFSEHPFETMTAIESFQ